MKFVVQRVTNANVSVDGNIVGSIHKGFLVLLGVSDTDTFEIADKMVNKLLNLRIFEDEQGKTNLNLKSVSGELLIISQFTLYADCRKGNRPSFTKAGKPDHANELYEYIIGECKRKSHMWLRAFLGPIWRFPLPITDLLPLCLIQAKFAVNRSLYRWITERNSLRKIYDESIDPYYCFSGRILPLYLFKISKEKT